MTFGVPPDPSYVAFDKDLERFLNGDVRIRWHPTDSKWYAYAIDKWALEEVSVGPTPSGAEWGWHDGTWGWKLPVTTSVNNVALWQAVSKANQAHLSRHGDLVWNPRDGSWRKPRELAEPGPVPDMPGPDDPRLATLKEPYRGRVASINEWERKGLLTSDQAAKLRFDVLQDAW